MDAVTVEGVGEIVDVRLCRRVPRDVNVARLRRRGRLRGERERDDESGRVHPRCHGGGHCEEETETEADDGDAGQRGHGSVPWKATGERIHQGQRLAARIGIEEILLIIGAVAV